MLFHTPCIASYAAPPAVLRRVFERAMNMRERFEHYEKGRVDRGADGLDASTMVYIIEEVERPWKAELEKRRAQAGRGGGK